MKEWFITSSSIKGRPGAFFQLKKKRYCIFSGWKSDGRGVTRWIFETFRLGKGQVTDTKDLLADLKALDRTEELLWRFALCHVVL